MLLEPFSVALENDRRLREMEALREAAEADKRSLLARLGRKQLADTIVGAETGLRRRDGARRAGRPVRRPRADLRRDRHRQGVDRPGDPQPFAARPARSIRVNCGAIPPELIDSQLFGHEQGRFTGAVEMRRGWFERADGGTLFLDEIGELPPAAQVRLLRILQDGWLERVGGAAVRSTSTCGSWRRRTATWRAWSPRAGSARTSGTGSPCFPIFLPPLRERREDIPALAPHFAQRAAVRFVLPLVCPRPRTSTVASYAWPGNVRELAAVIDRAAILGNGKRLEVAKALGISNVQANSTPTARSKQGEISSPDEFLSLDGTIKQHIEAALSRSRGQIEGRRGVRRRP